MWLIEGLAEDQSTVRQVTLNVFPFRVGRMPELELPLNFGNVSRLHAELYIDGDGVLMIRDLGSRNGTFVNRQQIDKPVPVRSGDIIHFGTCEFRVVGDEPGGFESQQETMMAAAILPRKLDGPMRDFLKLIESQSVHAHFQPIVAIANAELVGYEVLGRADLGGVPASPTDLFGIAANLGLEAELSRLFFLRGVAQSAALDHSKLFFFNLHHTELKAPDIVLAQIRAIREETPELQLVIEISEKSVMDLKAFRELHRQLLELGVKLAYDDFGAGQARLVELAEATPDFLKFDRALIQNIHAGPGRRLDMLSMLVDFARKAGITTLAEGIESREEAETCKLLGFELAQGFFFGQPISMTNV